MEPRTFLCLLGPPPDDRIPFFVCDRLTQQEREWLCQLIRRELGQRGYDEFEEVSPGATVDEIWLDSKLARLKCEYSEAVVVAFLKSGAMSRFLVLAHTLSELAGKYEGVILDRRPKAPDLGLLADEIDTLYERNAPQSFIDDHIRQWAEFAPVEAQAQLETSQGQPKAGESALATSEFLDSGGADRDKTESSAEQKASTLSVDPERFSVSYLSKECVIGPGREFRFFERLLESPNRWVEHRELSEASDGDELRDNLAAVKFRLCKALRNLPRFANVADFIDSRKGYYGLFWDGSNEKSAGKSKSKRC